MPYAILQDTGYLSEAQLPGRFTEKRDTQIWQVWRLTEAARVIC